MSYPASFKPSVIRPTKKWAMTTMERKATLWATLEKACHILFMSPAAIISPIVIVPSLREHAQELSYGISALYFCAAALMLRSQTQVENSNQLLALSAQVRQNIETSKQARQASHFLQATLT